LNQIGYMPDGITAASNSLSKRYYAVGFGTAGGTFGATCGTTGTVSCLGYVFNATGADNSCTGVTWNTSFDASAKVFGGGVAAVSADLVAGNIGTAPAVNQTAFTMGAAGQISTGTALKDGWTINQDKQLSNRVPQL
jgi:hypothetical protein